MQQKLQRNFLLRLKRKSQSDEMLQYVLRSAATHRFRDSARLVGFGIDTITLSLNNLYVVASVEL